MDVLKDLTGKRFGRWVVICRAENRGKSVMWECICDCGKIKVVHGTRVYLKTQNPYRNCTKAPNAVE